MKVDRVGWNIKADPFKAITARDLLQRAESLGLADLPILLLDGEQVEFLTLEGITEDSATDGPVLLLGSI